MFAQHLGYTNRNMVNVWLPENRMWATMAPMLLRLLLLACSLACSPAVLAEDIILPRLKPGSFAPNATENDAPPAQAKAKSLQIRFPGGNGGWSAEAVAEAQQKCRKILAGLKIDFEPLPPLGEEGGCGAPGAILVNALDGVAIEPPAEFNCELAEALHHWIAWSVKPAAKENLGKKLTVIHNASAYVCRRRNNSAFGKLSEHARANALDISTLGFSDGSSTNIKGDWSGLTQLIGLSDKSAFLKRIRRDACIRFTTVLGPGTDPYHGDHFHIDLIRRKNGYRICQ